MSNCQDCTELGQGEPGYNGWAIIPANVTDSTNLDSNGDARVVEQVIGWTGGTGPTPTQYVGQYLGSAGITPSLSVGTNKRGAKGVGYNLTSSTNLNMPVALASRTLTVNLPPIQSAFSVGARVRVSNASAPTVDYFEGIITAYTSATNFVLTIDYCTPTVTLNISSWNIDITGITGATAGFNDLPWVTKTAASGDIVLGTPATGVSGLSITNGFIRYKKLGRTMILNYNFTIEQTVAATSWNVAYNILIPGSLLQASTIDNGNGFGSINDSNGTNNLTSVTTTNGGAGYLRVGNFPAPTANGVNTAYSAVIIGSIVFETTT